MSDKKRLVICIILMFLGCASGAWILGGYEALRMTFGAGLVVAGIFAFFVGLVFLHKVTDEWMNL